jgi:hypothetical protein
LKTFCNEQELARGNFPAPVPVIFCKKQDTEEDDDDDVEDELSELAELGVSGIIVSTKSITENGNNNIKDDGRFHKMCRKAIECGLQPIPEIIIDDAVALAWSTDEKQMEQIVDTIANEIFGGQDPVSIVISIIKSADDTDNEEDDEAEKENKPVPLPVISKGLKKRVPIMGSIRMMAGENRLGEETARYKAAGYTGAVLRRECVPNYQLSPSLEFVSDFWAACIGDLKSTRSKTFNFRSKNNMEKPLSLEWAKYQKSVIESGALGEAEDNMPPGLNPDAGDYKGF